MGDNKVKIGIMAGVLIALVAAFFVMNFFLKGNTPSPGPAIATPPPGMAGKPVTPALPPAATKPGKPGAPTTHATPLVPPSTAKAPGGSKPPAGNPKIASGNPRPALGARPGNKMPAGMPGGPASVNTAPQPPAIPLPSLPPFPTAPAIIGVFDPFVGGPNPPKHKKAKPPVWPAMVMAYTAPATLPQKSDVNTFFQTASAPAEPQVGRMAGWIFNNNAQIVAIFDDVDGITHSVRVGDQVGDLTVKTITPEYMVVVDENGVKHTLKLQGLDSYGGKSRTVNVIATPSSSTATPAWNP